MRIRDLSGWPPALFQNTDAPPRSCKPDLAKLRLVSSTFLPGTRRRFATCDLLLIFEMEGSKEKCSSRFRIRNPEMGRQVEAVLKRCAGLSLLETGDRVIRAHPKNVSMEERE